MMMMSGRIGDLLRHVSIGSPLEPMLLRVRSMRRRWQARANPELKTVLLDEPQAIEAVLRRHVRDGMNCVDVGAHVGSMTDLLTRLSPRGKHIAIEPVPYKAKWLQEKYPQVEVVACAVANAPGEATLFYQSAASGYSGLRSARMRGESSFKVELRRLDDVVPHARTVELLKLDVEGGELDAFRGATRILSRDRPFILFECALNGLDAFHQSASETHAFLSQHRYAIYTPVDLLAGAPPLDKAAFERALRYPFRAFNFVAMSDELSSALQRKPPDRSARAFSLVSSAVAVELPTVQGLPRGRDVSCFPYAW